MRRLSLLTVLALVTASLAVTVAWAGSPHFIANAFSVTRVGNTITVSGKEAGLGDESQVHVVLNATGLCINGGGNHPRAVNKTGVVAEGTFPVQNGKANFTLTGTAVFSPSCSPPMTVRFTDVSVTDTTNSITQKFPGTF